MDRLLGSVPRKGKKTEKREAGVLRQLPSPRIGALVFARAAAAAAPRRGGRRSRRCRRRTRRGRRRRRTARRRRPAARRRSRARARAASRRRSPSTAVRAAQRRDGVAQLLERAQQLLVHLEERRASASSPTLRSEQLLLCAFALPAASSGARGLAQPARGLLLPRHRLDDVREVALERVRRRVRRHEVVELLRTLGRT